MDIPWIAVVGFLIVWSGVSMWMTSKREKVAQEYERRRVALGAGPLLRWSTPLAAGSTPAALGKRVLQRAPVAFRQAWWEPLIQLVWLPVFIWGVVQTGFSLDEFGGIAVIMLASVLITTLIAVVAPLVGKYAACGSLVRQAAFARDAAEVERLLQEALAVDPDVVAAQAGETTRGSVAAIMDLLGTQASARAAVSSSDTSWGEATFATIPGGPGRPPTEPAEPTSAVTDAPAAEPPDEFWGTRQERKPAQPPAPRIPGVASPPVGSQAHLSQPGLPDPTKPINPR